MLFTLDEPFKPTGALHALRGNLAPDGSLVKLAGGHRTHRGPALVFDSEEACTDAVRAGVVAAGRRCSSCATRARPAGPACARC